MRDRDSQAKVASLRLESEQADHGQFATCTNVSKKEHQIRILKRWFTRAAGVAA